LQKAAAEKVQHGLRPPSQGEGWKNGAPRCIWEAIA
jgi:hypothetical protein